jgi:UPF0716 protein FxsA
MRLIVLFLALPLIEIALFVTVGGWLTLWPTLAIVLGTGVLGVLVMRSQGLRVIRDLQSAQAAMRNPLSPMAHSALIMLAGIFLLLPGFFTDTLGLLLLLPPVRQLIIHLLSQRIRAHVVETGFPRANTSRPAPGGDWVDAEFIEIPPDPKNLKSP